IRCDVEEAVGLDDTARLKEQLDVDAVAAEADKGFTQTRGRSCLKCLNERSKRFGDETPFFLNASIEQSVLIGIRSPKLTVEDDRDGGENEKKEDELRCERLPKHAPAPKKIMHDYDRPSASGNRSPDNSRWRRTLHQRRGTFGGFA